MKGKPQSHKQNMFIKRGKAKNLVESTRRPRKGMRLSNSSLLNHVSFVEDRIGRRIVQIERH